MKPGAPVKSDPVKRVQVTLRGPSLEAFMRVHSFLPGLSDSAVIAWCVCDSSATVHRIAPLYRNNKID